LISGFYAVLDRDDPALAEALLASARVLQVRLKPASTQQIVAAARRAREITRRHGALLVINDRVDVALEVGAEGVHLGQDDLPLAAARTLAPGLIVGISTHDLHQVAAAQGADYLGFGPVFATSTKANPDPVRGVEMLAAAVQASKIPVIAIGGITPTRAGEVALAGAAGACAISAVNGAADVTAAGRAVAEHWRRSRAPAYE
jgi:thiamine-phosphate diphosphorylase